MEFLKIINYIFTIFIYPVPYLTVAVAGVRNSSLAHYTILEEL